MSQDNMELAVWGDGTIRLAFWDRMHGEDKIFILVEDGTAQIEGEKIDLIKELRKLAKQQKELADDFERG